MEIDLFASLINQHGIAVGKKSILLGDSFLVGGKNLVFSGKGGHQQNQSRAGPVEIGDQAIHDFEIEGWVNEKVGITGEGL